MGEALICVAILIGGYPLLVLSIALTGPHNETEKRELAEYKAARRRSRHAG